MEINTTENHNTMTEQSDNNVKVRSRVDRQLSWLQTQINLLKFLRAGIKKHRKTLAMLEREGIRVGYSNNCLDFDHLPHDKIVKVIQAFPGKWTKTASDISGRIDYKIEIDELPIRCWAGEPPPHCRVVEEIVEVPATTRTVLKIVCD